MCRFINLSIMNLRGSFICILLCLSCVVAIAQTALIDSLEHALVTHKNDDEAKTDLLRDLSFEYRDIDPQKCKEYAEQALELAQRIGSTLKEASAYNALGIHYYYRDMPYPAYVNYKKAESLLLEYGDKNELKEIYYNLMHLYISIMDGDNAAHYANKLLDITIEEGDLSKEIGARYTLGLIRFNEHPGQEGLDYYLDLYKRAYPLNNVTTYVVSLYCGEAYVQMGRYREGLPYLHRACEYFETHEESGFTMEACVRLADAYTQMHQVDSAELYIQKVLKSPFLYEDTRMRLLYNRSVLDSIKGNCWSSLTNFKAFYHLADSLAKDRNSNEVGRMKNWYEIEQKEKENQMLQQEQQKQHKLIYSLIGTLVLILVLIALIAYLYWRTAKKNSELKKLHEVKDKLFSIVAHDLRSPIGALMSMLRLINGDNMDAQTQSELLKGISNRIDDTYGLLDNLLCWTKSQMQGISPLPVYFDVQTESLPITDSLQGTATEKQIVLSNIIEKQQVYADKDMFAVVIRNLTTNALKYTFTGGEVTLSSKLSDNNMLVISVQDTGTGMTQEVQERLFKLAETKSKRGTNNESGTGLGLVLCADFIRTNGGSIWFETQQGKGTTFFFTLPCKPMKLL